MGDSSVNSGSVLLVDDVPPTAPGLVHREANRGSIGKLSRGSHLANGEVSPVGSKFREVFNDMSIFAARCSLVSELNLVLPHGIILAKDERVPVATFDGNASTPSTPSPTVGQSFTKPSTHGHLKVPSTEHGQEHSKSRGINARIQSTRIDGPTRPRGFSSSREDDETAELWRQAARAESASRSHRRSTSSNWPMPRLSGDQNVGQVSKPPQPSAIGSHSGSGSHDHSPTCTEPIENDENSFRKALIRSNTVLEEWKHQLQHQEREAKRKSRPLRWGTCPISARSKMPPASWARFPSHSRKQRNAQAGEADNVKLKDFAIKNVSATGAITWTTDKDDMDIAAHRSMVRSVSDKFTQPFKSRWSKFVPGRMKTPAKDRSSLGERRSSIQVSGDLEYPELELLPTAGGAGELQALEREVNEIRGIANPRIGLSSDGANVPTSRRSFLEEMTGALQHDGGTELRLSVTRTTVKEGSTNLSTTQSPQTPETQVRYSDQALSKDWTDSSGDRYATPLSHISPQDGLPRPITPETRLQLPALTCGSGPFQVEIPSPSAARLSLNERSVAAFTPPSGMWDATSSARRRSDPVNSSAANT